MNTVHQKIVAWVESDYGGSCPVSGTSLLAFLDSQQAEIAALKAERDELLKRRKIHPHDIPLEIFLADLSTRTASYTSGHRD